MANFAVYNTTTKAILMIVLDASNPNDAAWNPSGCAQVPIDMTSYNLLKPNITSILSYIAGLVAVL